MRDNVRRYRAIRDALTHAYPLEPTGNLARPLTALAALISGIVGSFAKQIPGLMPVRSALITHPSAAPGATTGIEHVHDPSPKCRATKHTQAPTHPKLLDACQQHFTYSWLPVSERQTRLHRHATYYTEVLLSSAAIWVNNRWNSTGLAW